jgi:hypothetical protein
VVAILAKTTGGAVENIHDFMNALVKKQISNMADDGRKYVIT